MYNDCLVTQIMAHSKNKCIGKDNTIPWKCRADMVHFSMQTRGKVCIMGRTTFDSIQPHLKGRIVIVVTGNRAWNVEHQNVKHHLSATDVNDALWLADKLSLDREIMVVGGRTIYQQTMSVTDKLLISEINTIVEDGDTFFDWEVPDRVEIVPFDFEVN